MHRLYVLMTLMCVATASAQIAPFPNTFESQNIDAQDVTVHVRVGGRGPAVVLLHGYGESGDMWPGANVSTSIDSGTSSLRRRRASARPLESTTRNSMRCRARCFGPMTATIMRFAATDVTEAIVPDSGHWIMEENPQATIAIVQKFLTAHE